MRVLVLSGGGSKGAFQLGVLDRLMDNAACGYDAVFGVSTGALSGAVIAQGSNALQQRYYLNGLLHLYGNLTGNRDIYTGGSNIVTKLWGLWRRGGMFNPAPLAALVEKYVGPSLLAQSSTHLEVGYTDLESGAYVTADGTNPYIKRFILASAFQPIFFQLFASLGDGGVRNQTPLSDAFRWIKSVTTPDSIPGGTIDIDVIVCNSVDPMPPKPLNYKCASDVLLRTFDIIENEVFLNDLRRALRNNTKPGKMCADIRLYAPATDLGDGLDFSPAMIAECIRVGRVTQRHEMTQ